VEYLERIANPEEPPLNFGAIRRKRDEFAVAQDGEKDALRTSLEGMKEAFRKPGDLSSWTPDVLQKIDQCFVKNYLGANEEPIPCLFFPDSPDNLKIFITYCHEVDDVLRRHTASAPKHARVYFAYYSIWQMQGWQFPVPLGTASVVGILNKMAKDMKRGFSEVSRGCCNLCPT
jgi:hypothetical protein